MPELESSKSNVGTNRSSFLSIFSGAIFKIFVWFLAVIIAISFIVPRFAPIEKIVPLPEINRMIYEKTGLEVMILGKARLSILPFFGITAHNVTVSNPSFEEKNLLSAKKIDIKIAIFPLIFNKLVIKNIILDNANIDIIKCNNNYNFLSKAELNAISKSTNTSQKSLHKFKSIVLSNLKISNSNFSYKVCNSNISHKISNIDAKVSMPSYDSKIKAHASIHIDNHNLLLNLQLSSLRDLLEDGDGEAILSVKSELGDATIEGKYVRNPKNPMQNFMFFDELRIEASGTNILAGEIAKQMQTTYQFWHKMPPVDFSFKADLTNHKLNISNFFVKSQHFEISSKDVGGTVSENPMLSKIRGTLVATILDAKNFCNTFEIDVKNLKNIPQQVNAQIDFTLENGIFQTHKSSNIKLNDITINIASILNFTTKTKSIFLNISSENINIDDYIENAQQKPITIGEARDNARLHITKIANIPVEANLSIKSLTYKNTIFKNAESMLKFDKNIFNFKINTSAFGGTIALDGFATSSDKILETISLKSSASNVEIGDFMKFLNRKTQLTGIATFQSNISANGSNIAELIQKSTGNATFEVLNPTINGVDIHAIITDAKRDYRKIFNGNIKEKYFLYNMKSKIDSISAKITIINGVLINDFFTARQNALAFNVSGEMNMTNGDLHYIITPSKNSSALPSLKIDGTTQNPVYSIEASSYIKQSARAIVEEEFSNKSPQEKLRKLNKLFNNIKK